MSGASYRKVTSGFWTGVTGRAITAAGLEVRVLAAYLMTCQHSNMEGLYYLPPLYASHESGLTEEEVLEGLETLEAIGFSTYDHATKYVWVKEMARYQVGEVLKPGDKRITGIVRFVRSLASRVAMAEAFYLRYRESFCLPSISFEGASKGLTQGPCKALRSQDQDQDQEQEQEQEQSEGPSKGLRDRDRDAADLKLDHEDPDGKSKADADMKRFRSAATLLWSLQEKLRTEAIPGTRVRTALDVSIKPIVKCLAAGRTREDCEHMLRVRADKARRGGKDSPDAFYFDGVSNWRPENFERALAAPDPGAANGTSPPPESNRARAYREAVARGDA